MLFPALLLLAVVGGVVVLALIFAKDPEPPGTPDASKQLDRFLADAREERPEREAAPRPRSIPTAKPRARVRQQPTPRQPEPVRPVEPPVVVIRPRVEPAQVVEPDPEPVPHGQPVLGSVARPRCGAGVEKLAKLLRDRDSMQAAFLLNEVLRPPKSRRRPGSESR
jgi:hypothetical protein